MDATYDPGIVGLSILVASYASFVTLDLARRVRTEDRAMARVWLIGGGLVMGSGIWAMHFVGMMAMRLPIEIGYDTSVTALSWLAAVAVSLLALILATRDHLPWQALTVGSLSMGLGICTMHYTGMAAIELAPGIDWDWPLVAASALIACLASAAALQIFVWMRQLRGLQARLAQGGAAVIMGMAISGMHYTGMAAARFPDGALCLSLDGLGGRSLGMMVVVSAVLLLSLTLFTSVLDARLSARAHRLTDSLQAANAQLQDANDRLQQLAFVDALTGLSNRALFEDRLRHAIHRVDHHNGTAGSDPARPLRLALLFIDLDGFKPVNDSYGHEAGDELLRQVANRFKRHLRVADSLARIGGDEFVKLLEDIHDFPDAVTAANRMLSAMKEPFDLAGRSVTLSCSIGVVIYPDHGQRDRLLAGADAAMYAAKRAGGGKFVIFEGHMTVDIAEQIELQEDLRQAASRGQLSLHYQPKVSCHSGQVHGVEALLRWKHPRRGTVSPQVFIPIAERFGIIGPIGDWVIDEACRQLGAWLDDGLRCRVAVNLSPHQLRDPKIVETIQEALERYHVAPGQLVCEITESAAMEDTTKTQHILAQLSALGVKLSIDDFGTGYSSLSYLCQLRPHELKIDRSFVLNLGVSSDARAVVDAVVRLARALDLRVVAEGVETRQQADLLKQLGCDELQGYFFAKPMKAAQLQAGHFLHADGQGQVDFAPSALMPD